MKQKEFCILNILGGALDLGFEKTPLMLIF